ncbi:MAG TPA: polysaccharide deacetylase family protein [Elusimicrobiota bacterium]|nr:polysaccharide deacetylase family protein [Elusimicrobiota bacterium]
MRKHLFRSSIAAAGLAVATVGVLAYGLGAPSATLLGPALVRDAVRPGAPPEVALTFDDGPSVPYTGQVLDILSKNHIHATFFLCGANAERYPDLVRRIQAEGHEIGNHTYSHPWLYLMERGKIAAEIDRTQDILQRITGRRPRYFRPPYGVRWFSLWPILAERGLTMVMWSIRGYDGRYGADGIARTTLDQLQPGGIILLHDGFETHKPSEVDRSNTVRALPAIISGIRRAGYKFVPISG